MPAVTMESSTPNTRCRARKPNFTNEEIDHLLELVSQSRHILLSNNNKAHGVRSKQVMWQEIGNDVTLNGWTQRDANDVRQKWKDLLRAANKDMRAIDAARKNNEELPVVSPYSDRVMQIKTGSPIFSDPSEDIHNGNFFATTCISLKREPGAKAESDSSGVASTSGWNQHNDKVKQNFNNKEIRCLITLYDKHKTILQDETKDVATNKEQILDIWRTIAGKVSEIGTIRTASECHKKWQKFIHQAKKEEEMELEEDEKGCSFSKSHFTDLLLRVNRTDEQVVENDDCGDEFWDSLEDNTGDIDDNSVEFNDLIVDDENTLDNVRVKQEPVNSINENGDLDGMMESPHENGEEETSGSSPTLHVATSVQSSPLKRTLSPKALRPDLPRKRKRISSVFNTSRLNTFQSNRIHSPGPSYSPRPINLHREKQELENRKLRLEVERLELENSIMRTQQVKMELETEKLRVEMEKIEQEKQKVCMEKELVAMNIKVLSQKLHNGDS